MTPTTKPQPRLLIDGHDIVDAETGELLATVYPTNRDGDGYVDGAALLQLFWAAPELLEALKLYVEHFGDPLKAARAAIAKATGEDI